jgi:hypothetical protein
MTIGAHDAPRPRRACACASGDHYDRRDSPAARAALSQPVSDAPTSRTMSRALSSDSR